MTHPLRPLASALLTLLTTALIAPSAHAQDDASPWSPSPSRPVLSFGVDLGVSAMNESGPFGFGNGIGSVTSPGPAWGLRAGIELFRWLGFEARYVGMYDAVRASESPTGSLGYFTSGGEAIVRFAAPFRLVRPYVFGGVGYYDMALSGSSIAKAGTVLHSTSQPGVPLGVGIEVPLAWQVSLGVEATYHFVIGESFSEVTVNGIDGGDVSTFNAVLRYRL